MMQKNYNKIEERKIEKELGRALIRLTAKVLIKKLKEY